ncbi:MAG: YidC/Oxa1 family membrane protein insertase [Muribaculaceae bacterium]|nr:YidC/Oxa1 family membrane protein insertase [Muribaculaceae bacterium]
MDFITLTIKFLSLLAKFVGNYGLAIILLTVIVRAAMWHLNVQQQRSMKKMQTLQPKLKAIQDRYQSNPQVMQQKMMEFYKEHKFNPMGGCLPLLIQMPIFILLYSALISPQFIQVAGNQHFLFVKSLATTMRATAGISNNGELGASVGDKFILGNTATVYLPGEVIKNVKVSKPTEAVKILGELEPGKNVDLVVSLNNLSDALKFNQLNKVEKVDFTVTNSNIRENETVTFERDKDDLDEGQLIASVPTVAIHKTLHWDVVLLIVLFAITMVISQKIMMAMNKSDSMDATQQALQKSMGTFMPLMIVATFVIIPIPAGVLLYLITSNIIQIAQTVIINKQIDMEEAKSKDKVSDSELKSAKKIN